MSKNPLALFKEGGRPKLSERAQQKMMEATKRLQGGSSGPRISIKGGRFRMIVGGEQVAKRKEDWMNIIVLDAGAISRTYFKDAYDPDATASPTCWSSDGDTPSPDVPKKMSKTCADCAMNIKGSGQGDSRACRFAQRIAVLLEGDDTKTVYGLQVPATSLFGGSGRGDDMPLQAYAKVLATNETAIQNVVTQVYFDDDAETPKLFWKPERFLEADEANEVLDLMDSPAVADAIAMHAVSGGGKSRDDDDEDERPAKRKARDDDDEDERPAKRKARDDDDEPVGEPVVHKKRDDDPVDDAPRASKLASVMDGWDDDDDD